MKIGIRNMVIPGARMQMIVVTKLTPDKDGAQPGQGQAHDPQVAAEARRMGRLVSGAYAYQPNAAAPPGVTKPTARSARRTRKSSS